MAISLKDIRNSKRDRKEGGTDLKERVLRPWETYDSLGIQTRTVTAQEAVKRARITVQKNNVMVESLKKNSYKPKENEGCKKEVAIQKKSIFWRIVNYVRGQFQ